MGEIILIKPASSDFREQNRILGNLDIPMSKEGEKDLEEVIQVIKDNELDTLYSSPSNPTGNVYTKEELTEFAKIVKDNPNVLVISEEINE